MRRNFLRGFLSGLTGAIVLVVITGALYLHFTDEPEQDSNKYEDVSAAENKDEGENSYDEIVEKLSVLQMLIDTFYLEEVDSEEYANLIESSSGVYHGIGAVVSQDVRTGIITIVKPYKGSPAYNVGLLPDDILFKVEGEEVTGKDLTEVVGKIKGKEDTEVNVTIYRDGVTEPMEFTIVRKKINIPTIEYEMLDDKIGYIQIAEFDDITISQFRNAVNTLEKKGMKSLVIDVRNNPGGLLNSVVDILDRLLPKGLIVYTEDKNNKREEKNAKKSDSFDKPMAVLINGNSASASEIFAGALQDYEKATVVGTTSFGKGIVQTVIPLTDGTAVKLTISKYFTPKGRNIHGTGIVPDVEVELDEELKQLITIPHDQDNQLQKAIEILKKQMK